jgi:autotransporter-associated beta strand protein
MCTGIAQNKTIASITDATHFVLNSGTGNATFSGAVSAIGPANSLGGWGSNDPANLVLNGGTLQYTGPAVSTARNFTLGTAAGSAIDASGSGALTWTCNPTLSGTDTARTFTLTGTNTDDNTFAGALGDNGAGATSLVKSGFGKWVLAGANTYTGDTIIEAGTLSITSAYLADAADVYLTTDAVFSLDFTGTDTIGELFFNDVTQAAGTWGASGSGADYTSTFFTGAGLLSVTGSVVLGDTNGDFVVDAADYIALKTNFGMTDGATLAQGNFDADIDGNVDWDDLQILMGIFGTRTVGGAPAVPEPGSVMLLMFGAAALLRRRKAA